MKRTAWIIRIAKTPEGKWRALKPVWSKRFSKPLLTQRALYKGAEIETPGGHWEIEWYEAGKRQRRWTGPHPSDAVKALAKQKLRLQAMDAGIVLADAEPADGKRPLRQAVEEFLAEKRRTNAHKTWIALKQVLELFLRTCARRYLARCTPNTGLAAERSQQFLWRDQRSPRLGVQPVEPWLQFPQCLIGHDTKRAQGVILRNSLLGAYVAEHIQLLLILSTHLFFLAGRVVETREFSGTGQLPSLAR